MRALHKISSAQASSTKDRDSVMTRFSDRAFSYRGGRTPTRKEGAKGGAAAASAAPRLPASSCCNKAAHSGPSVCRRVRDPACFATPLLWARPSTGSPGRPAACCCCLARGSPLGAKQVIRPALRHARTDNCAPCAPIRLASRGGTAGACCSGRCALCAYCLQRTRLRGLHLGTAGQLACTADTHSLLLLAHYFGANYRLLRRHHRVSSLGSDIAFEEQNSRRLIHHVQRQEI